jgi:hypothetical protein
MSFKSIALKDSPGWFYDHLETSGTAMLDASGNGADGVYVGSPTLNQRSLTFLPHEGRSVLFSGAKRATVPAGIVTTTTYTYEFLIRPETVSGVQCLAHDGTNGLYINNGKFSFYYSSAYHDADTTLVAGNKYLLHLVVTAGEVEFVVNRVSDGTSSSAPIFNATTLFAEDGGGNELNVSACISACYPGLALTGFKIRKRYRESFKVGYHKIIDNLNPTLHLTLSETSGTVAYDISGNEHDGAINGSPVMGQEPGPLHQSRLKAMKFDGVDDGIKQITGITVSSTARTINCWVKPDHAPGAFPASEVVESTNMAISWDHPSDASFRGMAYVYSGGFYKVFFQDLDTSLQMLTVVFNGVDIRTYRNGVYQNTAPAAVSIGTNMDVSIGNHLTASQPFAGGIGEVFINDADVTVQQIKQIYEAGKSRYAAEVISYRPVNYFRKNEASGNAVDLGSLGNDGVWTGTPAYSQASEIISNEPNNKSIAITTAESLAFTSHAATTTYSLLSIIKPAALTGSQYIFTDETDGLKLNGAKLGLYYSATEHDANTTLVAGEPHLVGVSVDAGSATFNLDGVSDGAAASVTAFAPTKMYNLTYAGIGDESAVFTTPLTDDEFLDIYEMASFLAPFYGFAGNITESLPATDFYVRANELDTGTFIADAQMLGDNTYTFDFSQITGYEEYANEVLLTCLPKTGKRRLNSTAYAVGDYYLPADVTANNHIYKVTVAGTTASSEPTLDQAGGTTVDGGVTVQDMGVCPTPITQISYAETIEL